MFPKPIIVEIPIIKWFKSCGNTNRTIPCSVRMTKTQINNTTK